MKINRKIERQNELGRLDLIKDLRPIARMYDIKKYYSLNKMPLIDAIIEHEESIGKFSTTPGNSPIFKPSIIRRSSGSK